MGRTNPDRAILPPTPYAAATLGEMLEQQWEVVAHCPRCLVALKVDLPMLINAHGEDLVLWGRRPPCRVVDCEGRVVFKARSHKYGSWVGLTQRLDSVFLARHRQMRLKRAVNDVQ